MKTRRQNSITARLRAFAAITVPCVAQQITGELDSPGAAINMGGKLLLAPAPESGGAIKDGTFRSKAWWVPRVVLPKGASNILLALTGLALAAVLMGVTGCATPRQNPLRVGVTPDYPPLVFEQGNGGVAGVEVDLANALGAQLGRPVLCIPMRWEQLIPALQEQRIDIIMSGMSVTPPRQLRVAFSEPYLHNQLRAIFSRQNADQFKTREDVLNTSAKIGVVPGTTADAFVQENCPKAERVSIGARRDAAFHLLQDRRIDLFVDDTFALAQILSENEAGLTYLAQPLAGDDLAWGIRPDDKDLLNEVNVMLARWKSDGTLDQILLRWMPYLHKYESLQQGGSTAGNAP